MAISGSIGGNKKLKLSTCTIKALLSLSSTHFTQHKSNRVQTRVSSYNHHTTPLLKDYIHIITLPFDMTRCNRHGVESNPSFSSHVSAGNRIRKCWWVSGCDAPNRVLIAPGREIARSSIVFWSLAKRRGHVAPCQVAWKQQARPIPMRLARVTSRD